MAVFNIQILETYQYEPHSLTGPRWEIPESLIVTRYIYPYDFGSEEGILLQCEEGQYFTKRFAPEIRELLLDQVLPVKVISFRSILGPVFYIDSNPKNPLLAKHIRSVLFKFDPFCLFRFFGYDTQFMESKLDKIYTEAAEMIEGGIQCYMDHDQVQYTILRVFDYLDIPNRKIENITDEIYPKICRPV